MATRVETIAECDRCGKEERSAGRQWDSLPMAWVNVVLTRRLDNAWAPPEIIQLCSSCAGVVFAELKEEVAS